MSRIIAIVVVALLLLVGGHAVSASFESGGEKTTIENETWTADPGNVTELNRSKLDGVYYEESVDVRDANGDPLSADVDYRWHDTNGTIEAIEGGALNDGDTADVTYSYSAPTDEQQGLASLFASSIKIGSAVVIALAAALGLGALRVLGGA